MRDLNTKEVSNMKSRILIVEDDKKLCDKAAEYLRNEGYDTSCAYNGLIGENLINNNIYDLIILDIMMPGKDGWSLLRKIKSSSNTPVIITTARGDEEDRIFGLELGADDYMVKPISIKELSLRIKLRIKSNEARSFTLELGDMCINENNREVTENEKKIILTPKEFDLLFFLCSNRGQVFKREQLLDKIWKYDFVGDSRTVDTHIKNLREKILFCSAHIKTVWGVGYKLE